MDVSMNIHGVKTLKKYTGGLNYVTLVFEDGYRSHEITLFFRDDDEFKLAMSQLKDIPND